MKLRNLLSPLFLAGVMAINPACQSEVQPTPSPSNLCPPSQTFLKFLDECRPTEEVQRAKTWESKKSLGGYYQWNWSEHSGFFVSNPSLVQQPQQIVRFVREEMDKVKSVYVEATYTHNFRGVEESRSHEEGRLDLSRGFFNSRYFAWLGPSLSDDRKTPWFDVSPDNCDDGPCYRLSHSYNSFFGLIKNTIWVNIETFLIGQYEMEDYDRFGSRVGDLLGLNKYKISQHVIY